MLELANEVINGMYGDVLFPREVAREGDFRDPDVCPGEFYHCQIVCFPKGFSE